MSKDWDGVLEKRQCVKEGCERTFKVLPTSPIFHCCAVHDPAFIPPENCWTPGVIRGHRDQAKDPRKV